MGEIEGLHPKGGLNPTASSLRADVGEGEKHAGESHARPYKHRSRALLSSGIAYAR